MDNEEFKRIAYPELAAVLTDRQGDILSPQPLEISPWLAMSLLQKSIRRGETGHALHAAATLLRDAPDRLWKRLAIAVFEDIGLGSLDLIAPIMIATSGKGVRKRSVAIGRLSAPSWSEWQQPGSVVRQTIS